ncbi:MAG: glycosyltransferase [Candidatus Woesearchaeota archaeon]
MVYVLELAKALCSLEGVDKVEIITCRIIDPEYPGYDEKIEKLTDNVSIVRIECGPRKYLKKVDLWPYLDELIENTKKHIKRVPDIFQSNYEDSGLVCARLAKHYNRSKVHTGHSLGIPKMQRQGINKSNKARYKAYHFDKRIKAEQEAIDNATAIFASTREEIRQQYSGYDTVEEKFRCIPPGIDLKKFHPPKKETPVFGLFDNIRKQQLRYPDRRIISVLSRMDRRNNITGLLEAFASIKDKANLLIFANTLSYGGESQPVIDEFNRIMRKRSLYGHVALPGISLDYATQVPEYYRYLASKGGIFVNPALIEPFGLTVVEAAACGVPVVATNNGGPTKIITDKKDGLLINPKDKEDMASKMKRLCRDRRLWKRIADNGIKNAKKNFSWKKAAHRYFKVFKEVI